MKEKLLKIINHFGIRNQLKKLNEECYELIEAVNYYELKEIIEEVADVQVLLNEIKAYYDISDEIEEKVMLYKIDRTLERIESGYYKKESE